jgi:hypothetical protein
MDSLLLYSKISVLPEEMKEQVSDFVDFLTSKARKDNKLVQKPFSEPVVIDSILQMHN